MPHIYHLKGGAWWRVCHRIVGSNAAATTAAHIGHILTSDVKCLKCTAVSDSGLCRGGIIVKPHEHACGRQPFFSETVPSSTAIGLSSCHPCDTPSKGYSQGPVALAHMHCMSQAAACRTIGIVSWRPGVGTGIAILARVNRGRRGTECWTALSHHNGDMRGKYCCQQQPEVQPLKNDLQEGA